MMGSATTAGLAARLRRRFSLSKPGPVILMYHRIAEPDVDPWRLAVSPARFAAQLSFLRSARTVLPLVEFAARHRSGRLTADCVAITFDDGYACNATTAAPLLQEHGLPATVFLMTNKIDDPAEFWSDALERIVTSTTTDALVIDLPGGPLRVSSGPQDPPAVRRAWNAMLPPRTQRQKAYLALWGAMREMPAAEQGAALAALHRQSAISVEARESHRAVTSSEARSLAHNPSIEIGAHSVTHPRLSCLSAEAQFEEITLSRKACSALAGSTVDSFAYPYGDYSPETIELVGLAGYQVACTTQGGAVASRHGALELPRMPVLNWSARALETALKGQR